MLLGGFSLALAYSAQTVMQPDSLPGGAIPAGRLEEWMRDTRKDSFPVLSREGRESKQFGLIVREIEKYLGRDLEPAQVAEVFQAHLKSLQDHFREDPGHNSPDVARQAGALTGLTVEIDGDRLVLGCRGESEKISLRRTLAKVAEEAAKKASRLLADRNGIAAPVLWFLWVESCLDVLDSPYNHYIYADEIASSKAMSLGKTFGPGFVPELSGESVVVQNLFDPALKKSGLAEGSVLEAINGEPLSAEAGYLFDKWLQEKKFTYEVSFRAGGSTKTLRAEAVPYRHPTVSWSRLQDIAYIRLSRFSRDSLIEMRRVLRGLNRKPPKGLVIDLRGNRGGTANFGLVDCFFKPGQGIGAFREMPSGELQKVDASFEYYDYPVAVIVDRHSASMSEVFAAAFLENRRGTIIGEQTAGKGVGQSCLEIGEEGRLCLVTHTYYYPGTEITWNGEGIPPDIPIGLTDEEREGIDRFLSRTIPDLDTQVKTDQALARAVLFLGGN